LACVAALAVNWILYRSGASGAMTGRVSAGAAGARTSVPASPDNTAPATLPACGTLRIVAAISGSGRISATSTSTSRFLL